MAFRSLVIVTSGPSTALNIMDRYSNRYVWCQTKRSGGGMKGGLVLGTESLSMMIASKARFIWDSHFPYKLC